MQAKILSSERHTDWLGRTGLHKFYFVATIWEWILLTSTSGISNVPTEERSQQWMEAFEGYRRL